MKKLGIMILALLFAGTGMVKAQQSQQNSKQMKVCFQKTVLPFVKQQQAKFEKVLSTSEKKTLESIRQEFATFRKQGSQIRKNMHGNSNRQERASRKQAFSAIVAKVRKLTDAHPKEAEAYKKAIETEMAKWKAEMQGMRSGMGRQTGHGQGMGNRPHPMFQKLSDPALGLLMDGNQMNGMMMHRMMKGNRHMGRTGGRNHGMMATRNPEIRAKVKAYAYKNIFPVISKERKAFDKVLSRREKKIIAKARQQMQTRKAKLQQMHGNAKTTMNDSVRLAMWQQMDKSRIALRQIVLDHYGELQKKLAFIRLQMPQWKQHIRNIIRQNRPNQRLSQKPMGQHNPTNRHMSRKLRDNRGEIKFLLFDPQHPDSKMFLHPMPEIRK
ncbi:MAG: hypothetical protein IEMM0006_0805 [bacterium]|nr:MAG: hypothetical protein IEMM0006_0805 [bacterium]